MDELAQPVRARRGPMTSYGRRFSGDGALHLLPAVQIVLFKLLQRLDQRLAPVAGLDEDNRVEAIRILAYEVKSLPGRRIGE